MSYQIITTAESELTFYENLDYLAKEWDDKVTDHFIDRVDNVIQKIKQNPFLFPPHGYENNVRKAIINKRIILYYRIIDDAIIELLVFWNTARDPNDLKY
jgi:hypothetical protein